MQEICNEYNNFIKYAKKLGCNVKENVKLSEYTSFKIGGLCKAVISVNSVETAKEFIKKATEENLSYYVLGKGSNVLVEDNGFDGLIFLIGKDFSDIKLIDENIIECESGVSLSKLASFAYENSLTGLEFSFGIPGTVGGAVFMNAGAYGGEIKDIIISAQAIDKKGNVIEFEKDQLDLSYRHSVFSNNEYIITKAVFGLQKGDKEEIRSKMDELMSKRKNKQPLDYPSAGSTFKRPEGSYASLLIEQCGLKGLSVGGAEVSTKHSGFVINKNNASCKDVIDLISEVKRIVLEKTGYNLECEVKIISNT